MEPSDWEIKGPPAWAREPLAWAACMIDALPLAVVSWAFLRWGVGAVPVLLGLGLYLAIFTGLVLGLKPWRVSRDSAKANCERQTIEARTGDRVF